MRIAIVDTMRKPKVYSIASLKLGAWRRSLGDMVELFVSDLPEAGAFDEIWLSTLFTFNMARDLGLVKEALDRCSKVRAGGVSASLLTEYYEKAGAVVHVGLMPPAELCAPDYSLLPEEPDYSITHTTRGCVRKCKFCMVPKLEPEFISRSWVGDIHPRAGRILFYDNNWLAKDFEDLRADVKQIVQLQMTGGIQSVDFNQALDCRLLTEKIADLLQGVPIKPLRFAFDGMHEDGHYQRAIRRMVDRGFTSFVSYVLYNYMDKPADFYYRLRESVELGEELGVDVDSFPMRYQPILEVDKGRDYIGKHWTPTTKKGFMTVLNMNYITGVINSDREEFVYWWGNSSEEFERLLNYPKLNHLVRCKKGALRAERFLKHQKQRRAEATS